jgi:glycosyltransferase 2 family protein
MTGEPDGGVLRRARPLAGAAVLAVLVWRLGTSPFLAALRAVDGAALVAAGLLALLTTLCCAWRWSVVARGLGVSLPLRVALGACYRSQFLNLALPGGILGDVHRAVAHGRVVGDLSRAARSVAWERLAGQVVQLALTGAVLSLLPSPARPWMPVALAMVAGAVVAAGLVCAVILARSRSRARATRSRWASVIRTAVRDVRLGLVARATWPGVLCASAMVVVGHVATFVVAARTAGATVSTAALVPLALMVLMAMSLPVNLAGWGPREGAAAWTFALAGLGSNQGVTTAVVYGVLVFVAGLPGAGLLAADWVRRGTAIPSRSAMAPAVAGPRGGSRG